jgi:threonine dehydrogenase-like Zn-dependent dehydrogenase
MFPELADTLDRGINVGSKKDLEKLFEIFEANQVDLKDVIDKSFDFGEAVKAFEYLKSGAHTGKVIVEVS